MEMVLGKPIAPSAPAVSCGASLPLSMVSKGETVTVSRVRAKGDFSRHLANLGFVEGATVHVVNQANGDTIVKVKGAQLGLDRDTARRIITA